MRCSWSFKIPLKGPLSNRGRRHYLGFEQWRNLGKAPLIVSIDRLFLLLAPKDASKWSERDERERVARTKREQLEAWFDAGVTPIAVMSSTGGGQLHAIGQLFELYAP